MCLTIEKGHKGVVLKAPHIAYKGFKPCWHDKSVCLSPYRGKQLPLGKVITARVNIDSNRYTHDNIGAGLHFSSDRSRARYHSCSTAEVLYVLLLPGSRVYYSKDVTKHKRTVSFARDCVTNKYVLFRSLKELRAWWDANWEQYTKE